jgi:hypothetical protein
MYGSTDGSSTSLEYNHSVKIPPWEMLEPPASCRRWKSALDGLDVMDPSNVSEDAMTVGEAMHARTERLSRHTREHAHDVNAWLQYTLHQQDLLIMSGE